MGGGEGEILVARFGYRLKSGHWKVDTAIDCAGVLRRADVLPLDAIRRWGTNNYDWPDNAWLCMHNHARQGSRSVSEGGKRRGMGTLTG